MEKQDKIKIAITSGVAAVILLILVLVLSLGGKKDDDSQKLEDNIAAYSSSEGASDEVIVPDTLETAESSETITEDASAQEASSQNSALTITDGLDQSKAAVSGNSFYAASRPVLHNVYGKVKYSVQPQLYEMYEYWSQGDTDAVRDLAHLERFEAMSYSLSGTSDFYYYGEKDSEGRPNGMGLAAYANSEYYFGYWSEGKRSGRGSWIAFYPNYNDYVVTEHLYSGDWANDLPDGEGQDHYDYDLSKMNPDDIYLQNAIGNFSQGKYNGEMYVITVNMEGNTTEWDGTCDEGDWEEVPYASLDNKGRIPVLSSRDDSENHIYMTQNGSRGNGVRGIIFGGRAK